MRLPLILFCLLFVISFVAGYVEPSKRKKNRFRDLVEQSETRWNELDSLKSYARQLLREKRSLTPDDEVEDNLLEELESMIYRE